MVYLGVTSECTLSIYICLNICFDVPPSSEGVGGTWFGGRFRQLLNKLAGHVHFPIEG